MKYIEYIAAAIALAGALLNKWNLPGADIFVFTGLGILIFVYALAGSIFFKIQEKRGSVIPYVVFSSLSLAVGVVSLLFSHLSWSYSTLLAIVSFIALPATLLLNFYQISQKNESPVPKMFVIRASILLVALIVF
ncbi:MAG: hypothetical protein U0W24_12255 [Bacteroidales bacterium]